MKIRSVKYTMMDTTGGRHSLVFVLRNMEDPGAEAAQETLIRNSVGKRYRLTGSVIREEF